MRYKPTVSIFIPAFNAEQNIARLLGQLILQRTSSVVIKEIVVISDASSDDTINKAKSIKNGIIKVYGNTAQQGFAHGVKRILQSSCSDIVVILNDDIVVKHSNIIEELCNPIIKNHTTGMVGGNLKPLPSRNFIQNTTLIGFILARRVIADMPTIHTKRTCDDKIMALSKSFYKKLKYPKNLGDMGNVDVYLYFMCLATGFSYYFALKSVVYFKFPDTVTDFININLRNKNSDTLINSRFKNLIIREYAAPKKFYEYLRIEEIIRYFPHLIFLFVAHYWIELKGKLNKSAFPKTWSVVGSTKQLSNI